MWGSESNSIREITTARSVVPQRVPELLCATDSHSELHNAAAFNLTMRSVRVLHYIGVAKPWMDGFADQAPQSAAAFDSALSTFESRCGRLPSTDWYHQVRSVRQA